MRVRLCPASSNLSSRIMAALCSLLLPGLSAFALLGAAEPPVPQPAQTGTAILIEKEDLQELWNEGDFTEGVAVAPDGTIYFSDITDGSKPGRILKYDPKTGKTLVHSADSGQSNGLMFDRQGKLIAACGANKGKIALCEVAADGTLQVLVDRFEGKRFNAPNDLVIHQDGSIYFSDPRYVGDEPLELDHMSVFRFVPATKVLQRVTTDISKPNGLVVSPDGKTLYVAETDNGTVNLDNPGTPGPVRMTFNAFPILEDGTLGERKVLHDFGDQLGIDGMTVDTEGRIYAAVRSPQRFGIVVYSPEGQELAYIPTPELPTNCCFGIGTEKQTLYITVGGGLYRIRLKTTGHHPATS